MKEESGSGSGLTIVGSSWARVCDTCRAAPCTVYCRADSAYLCGGCDGRVHAANRVAWRHERVWVCEACERAPAAFLCKADAARLCVSCDSEIHSANPLARRHQRVAITVGRGQWEEEEVEDEAASWLLPIPEKNGGNQVGLFGGEVDEYLDLVEYNSCEDQYNNNNNNNNGEKSYGGGDSVVPVECEGKDEVVQVNDDECFQVEGLEFESSPNPAYSYNAPINHPTVSISSLDIGVVPDSTRSDVSMSHPRPPKGTIDLFSGPSMNMPSQLSPMDREARVLRYREKKKTRKFEKTIRYASRKAYAETRPRIKGRFAKRTDVEIEVDQMFSTSLMAETGYGIVPSF